MELHVHDFLLGVIGFLGMAMLLGMIDVAMILRRMDRRHERDSQVNRVLAATIAKLVKTDNKEATKDESTGLG